MKESVNSRARIRKGLDISGSLLGDSHEYGCRPKAVFAVSLMVWSRDRTFLKNGQRRLMKGLEEGIWLPSQNWGKESWHPKMRAVESVGIVSMELGFGGEEYCSFLSDAKITSDIVWTAL